MTFDELMSIRRYLNAAAKRLTTLSGECDINTISQWCRFNDSWIVVKKYMDAHPELL